MKIKNKKNNNHDKFTPFEPRSMYILEMSATGHTLSNRWEKTVASDQTV
jgi:hypothetical protein